MTSYYQSSKKGGNEPWRNKERHYCPLCNAWMGSDRQSISLHENGKKHREAVEQDLVARREHKAKKEKNEKDLESAFAKVNAAVGISVDGSANFRGARPWECLPPALGNVQQQHQQSQGSSSAQPVKVGSNKRPPQYEAISNASSTLATGTKSADKLAKVLPFDPNVGHYELEGTTYLEGQHYASIFEEGMPIQLWMGGVAATASEKRDLRNFANWKMALLAKIVTKRHRGDDGRIACHVSYLQNSNDDHETLESNIHPSRIRLVLGSDPMIPSSIEEAHLALMGGEQIIELSNNNETNSINNYSSTVAPDIDENTGLSGWSTTSIRKISSHYERNQEKKRKREHEKELAEYKEKKEREIQARKMEEAKYANAHDSALGAYDVWSSSNSAVVAEGEGKATRSYKGVDITKEVQIEATDTAKSLAKGMGNVAFKKKNKEKTVKKQNNVRRTLADDD